MPYKTVTYEDQELVGVDCKEAFCRYNDGEDHCGYEGDVEDLHPDNPTYCNEKEYYIDPGEAKEFKSKKDLDEFIDMFDELQFSHQIVDEDSLRLLYLEAPCPSGKHGKHQAFIQVSKEHEDLYDYRPNTYGSFEIVPKNQVKLELA